MRTLICFLSALACCSVARAGEAEILANIRTFFNTRDAKAREQLARSIEQDDAYDRARVSEWLHRAGLFEKLSPGRITIRAALADGTARQILIRVPPGYDPTHAYPLIYCLHGQGGHADGILRYFEALLGDRADKFVLAAPDQYDEAVIHHSKWPPTGEHLVSLERIRETINTDADRTFVAGYSRGGHTSWTLGVLHADQWAGVMPLSGTFLMAEIDRLWEYMLGNVTNTHILAVWGENDVFDDRHNKSADGGIAGLDRRLRKLAQSIGTPLTAIELPGIGHGGVRPPKDELDKLLSRTRVRTPANVRTAFRHPYQAGAYWLEGALWTGKVWGAVPPMVELPPTGTFRNDDVHDQLAKLLRSRLGEIKGHIDGQTLSVRRRHLRELYVWISDGMIDWDQPVKLEVNGRKVFEGAVHPDLFVCLSQAQRTRDFERLRWAGFKFHSGKKLRMITGDMQFPPTGVSPDEFRKSR